MASLSTSSPTLGLSDTFTDLKKQGKVAFIPYITAGDPDFSTTAQALKLLDACGCDIIESNGGRSKRKYEMGRQPTNTKLSSNKTVRRIRIRGGNVKWRALRLDTGNYSWRSEAVTRKTRVLDVVFNASNNELVRTKTLVKSTIVQVDAAPFKQWYLQHYGVEVGRKKKNAAYATKEAENVAAAPAPEETKKSNHVHIKIQARQEGRNLDSHIEDQLSSGRFLACILFV